MKSLFAAFLVAHGLIHLLGTAKAFRIAAIPMLSHQIERPLGILWLLAAALFIATAICLFAWPRCWWVVGGAALVLSQLVIVTSWGDARYGTIANIVFVGLSLVAASLALENRGRERHVRYGFLLGGVLCPTGAAGPAVGSMRLQLLGVFGYGAVLPVACLLVSRLFRLDPRR